MNSGRNIGVDTRTLISQELVELLEAVYGYDVKYPNEIITFYANLNTVTGVLDVQGDPGTADDRIIIVHETTGITDEIHVYVNDSEESIPTAAVSSIVVNAGDGNDTINLASLPADIFPSKCSS